MTVIAVDCGGTNLTVAGVERASEALEVSIRPTPSAAEGIPEAIIEAIGPLLPGATAVGVSIAGLVEGGSLVWMPHRDGGSPIAAPLASATGVPVVVDNDANLACLAEATAGAGAGYRMVLMVTVGTGIGGGLVIDGGIEHGRGFLGEIGHTTLDSSGPTCSCGRSGCWESFASGRALDRAAVRLAAEAPEGRVAGEAGGRSVTGHHLVAAARAGDPAAAAALDEVGSHLGRGLANMVAVLDPDVIVVGGGVGSIGEQFLAPARAALAESVSGAEYRRPTPVVVARFGPSAGLVGAALLAGAPV